MTSARMAFTNRVNGRKGRGPTTAAGKVRAKGHARRHGLSLPVLVDPALAPDVETLARRITRSVLGHDDDPRRHELACRIAEAQLDLVRVRTRGCRSSPNWRRTRSRPCGSCCASIVTSGAPCRGASSRSGNSMPPSRRKTSPAKWQIEPDWDNRRNLSEIGGGGPHHGRPRRSADRSIHIRRLRLAVSDPPRAETIHSIQSTAMTLPRARTFLCDREYIRFIPSLEADLRHATCTTSTRDDRAGGAQSECSAACMTASRPAASLTTL